MTLRNLGRWAAIALACVFPLSAHAAKRITSCQVLSEPGAYVLDADITSPGTCLSVQASGITLDLNQHTITYGGAAVAEGDRYYGIIGQACWDKTAKVDPRYCGGKGNDNFTVRNGTIRQADGAPPYSHAIRLGAGKATGLKVEHMKIEVSSPSSVPIFTYDTRGGHVVHDVEFINKVTKVLNRHQIEGASVRMLEMKGAMADEVTGVKITGGAQGGILLNTAGSHTHDNDISLLGTYTNDFAIYAWGDKQEVFHNHIHGQGRGIHADRATGMRIHDNTISVTENSENAEYEGCQIGGAYGIQVEGGAKDVRVEHNEVEAIADICDARAYRQSDTPTGHGNISTGNHYLARRTDKSTHLAAAASFFGGNDALLDGDVLEADGANVDVGWSGGSNIVLKNVRFIKGANAGPDYATFNLKPGSNNQAAERKVSIRVIDGSFEKGASPDSFSIHPIGYEKWALGAQYAIEWTLKLKLTTAAGQPAAGAAVTIADQKGTAVFSGASDTDGNVPPVTLVQFRRFNTVTGVEKESFLYQVRAEKDGTKLEFELEPTAPTSLTKALK